MSATPTRFTATNDIDTQTTSIVNAMPKILASEVLLAQPSVIYRPAFVLELAAAAATLYVGYTFGKAISDVGSSVKETLDAIKDVARRVDRILAKLEELIDEIKKAIEIINRHTDEAFLRSHMIDIQFETNAIRDLLTALEQLPKDIKNVQVLKYLADLETHQDRLAKAIYHYLHQEQSPPTIAAAIFCAPPIAAWAQTHTIVQRYRALDGTWTPIWVWSSTHHQYFRDSYEAFFAYMDTEMMRLTPLLGGLLRTPQPGETLAIKADDFVPWGGSPFPSYGSLKDTYSRERFDLQRWMGVTYVKAASPLDPDWRRAALVPPFHLFPDPAEKERVHNLWREKDAKGAQVRAFIAEVKQMPPVMAQVRQAFAKPADWP